MSVTALLRQYTTALTLTNDAMYPGLIDQVHREVPYLWYMSNRGKAGGLKFENGGTQLTFDIINAKNNNTTAYYGFQSLTPAGTEEITKGLEPWKSNAQMVSVHLDEILENYGEEGIIKIAPAKYQVALMSMYGEIHRQLVQGVVGTTGAAATRRFQPASSNELLPLGFLIQKEFTNVDLIHQINQNTETYFQNQVNVSAATTFAGFRAEMRDINHDCSFGSTLDAPDLGLCTQDYYQLIEAATDDRRRYVDETTANVAFEHVVLGPTMYIIDHMLPDFGDTNADAVTLTPAAARAACVLLNTNWIEIVVHEMAYFTPTPWVEAINQTAIHSKIIFKACHRVTQRRKHGLHLGVTGTIAS